MKTDRFPFPVIALAGALIFLVFQEADASVDGGSHPARENGRIVSSLLKPGFNGESDVRCGISIILDGTDEGVRSLLDGECDLAMASRKMHSEERMEAEDRDLDIREATIGEFGIAVVVHPSNCVDELTVDQVHKIFNGTFNSWSEVGGTDQPISIITLNTEGSRISAYVSQTNGKGSLRQIRARARESLEPNEVALVQVEKVGHSPKVKILAIKRNRQSQGVLPTQKDVDRGEYPFVQPMYLYIDWKRAGDEAKAFFTFCARQYGNAPGK